jgi:hypothetical protein
MNAEWTGSTVSQAEAEAGTATTRRAWTAQRVRQAIAAWWGAAKGSLVGPIALASGGFSIARTAVTTPAESDGNVFSGTYTPTLTNVTNVSASTAVFCQYMRVGNVVTVSGRFDLTPTAANADTIMDISLPIASTFSAFNNCAGTSGVIATTVSELQNGSGLVYANTTDNRARFRCAPSATTNRSQIFHFTYRVI